jgi:signal recognition particle receptor subunit alpha
VCTANRSTDLLRAVLAAKEAGRVYSAVFVGINGVGKSTSLAKVAYYLKSNGVDVMLAACDTYRSVEPYNVPSTNCI